MNEMAIALLLCNLLNGGETEVRHTFPNLDQPRSVRVDCETPTHVIEIGLDGTPSSRDSVHQAVFAAFLTYSENNPKRSMVIMIDRDGVEDRWEYETRIVTMALGIPYGRCKANFLSSWSASAPFRKARGGRDLPPLDVAKRHCDLAGEFGNEALNPFPVLGIDKPNLFSDDPVDVRLSD